MDELLFTPAALLDLLLNIEELKDYELSMVTKADGGVQLYIGESVYDVKTAEATVIPVDDDVVETVSDVNDTAYDELIDEQQLDVDELEPVEGGPIKEALKSLFIGGMVRLAAKTLKD